jgi:predicted ATPase
LRVHVAAVRKALGDGREGNRFIVSDPGRGYRFVAPVTREQPQEVQAPRSNQRARSGNLPILLTHVVGRDEIIETVVSRCSQHRLVTIVGPGGIGKTTVAIAAGEQMSASFVDGIWFVALATLVDAGLVPATVEAALGMPSTGVDPVTAIAAWSRDRHILIVLDCCEHVAGAAAAVAEAVLRAGPRQQTLRATMDWSYDLLPKVEKVVLRRLAVFRGTFAIEAAASIVSDEDIRSFEVIEIAADLSQKSLVSLIPLRPVPQNVVAARVDRW